MGKPSDHYFLILVYDVYLNKAGYPFIFSKGQALQFNWLFEKGAFVLNADKTFSVDFDKVFICSFAVLDYLIWLDIIRIQLFSYLQVEGAVESLSRKILTIQARGDKDAASELLQKYCEMTKPLKVALEKLEMVQV